MLCVRCHKNPATISTIVNGVYYANICHSCKLLLNPPQASSGHARWERGIDLENNEANIQQPYNQDGSINTKFIKLYPKQAKAVFTDEQISNAIRL